MNTTKLLTLGLIILGLFGLSGMTTATVTIADGNDGVNFAGEALTATWTGSSLNTYVWVTSDASNLSNVSAYCIGTPSAGLKLSYVSSYVLNTSINCTGAGTYFIYVNNTNNETSPEASASNENTYFGLNTFNVTVSPDYNTFGVLAGDNVTVTIATAGPLPGSTRVGATFTVATTETGATPVKVSADSASGNVTYIIPVTSTAAVSNVTVSNGAAQGTGKYAVRTFNIKAYDRTISTNESDKVVLEALDATGNAANYSSAKGDLTFALVISGLADNVWNGGSQTLNVVFPSGANTSVISTKLATGTTTGTATITATCANLTLSDAANYLVIGTGQNVTITSTKLNATVTTTFNVDQNVTINGWINNDTATVNINITNGTAVVKNITGITPAAGGAWTTTWDTALTTLVNVGNYTILAWKNGSVNNSENATATITLTDAIAVTSTTSTYNGTNLTDAVYADGTLTINGTSSRVTGKPVLVNVTNAAGYTSISTPSVTNGTFGTTWTATVTAAGTYTVTVTDGLVIASKTITVLNNLTAAIPANGPVASTVALKGTSTRIDATNVSINVTDASSIKVLTNAQATITSRNWTYNWATYMNGNTSQAALVAGVYTVTVYDGITTTSGTITLDTGSINGVTAAPASIFLDDTVNITGTSTFPIGTNVFVNVTNCAGVTINSTTASVLADQTFLVQWVPSTAWANIVTNTAIRAGVPATLCVAANISTKTGSTNFTIKDDLALTTATSAVTGDLVILTGTSSRTNTTGITITVSLANYAVTQNAQVSGGVFTNNTYYATTTGLIGGAALPAGTYTINATDGVVSVIKNITIVADGVITITTPVQFQNISIGDNYNIIGTSNRANGTGVNITIAGQNNTKTNATVNTLGAFNATWNTTGYVSGYYYITAQAVVNGALAESTTVAAFLTSQTTTTTTTTTTTSTSINGTTTTSTTLGTIPEHPTITQVINAINLWAADEMTLDELLIWIQRWASSA
ncbi:MAG: hypothetical protein WAX07_02280 [Candidatus Altiarchaeia archaeon]